MDGSVRFPAKGPGAKKKATKERYKPKTKLGKRLMKWRRKVIASGERLLGVDEVLEETRRRRGRSTYADH